jgi:DNA repair protein RadA/Sms
MSKIKKAYFCQSCGFESAKWLGKCSSCNQWNTFVEEIISKTEVSKGSWKTESTTTNRVAKPILIHDIEEQTLKRYVTPDNELNRVLGGGIVPGALILIGGDPGIGKSTLMLQLALNYPQAKTLYVSGEESESQIKMRAERIGIKAKECYILAETQTQLIFKQIEILQPNILVIDSIQTLSSAFVESAAGSISQVRECAAELMRFAKETGTPVFLIGHITKEGTIAGPKVLEHMVDTVLQFEGDRHLSYRILRTIKNRFGSTSELGIYEMQGAGLREVSNPSEILISQKDTELAGISIGASLEGNRPLLIEIQSLVGNAAYGTPQRSSTGYDNKRINMLLAVLEKRGGFRLGTQDVFLNIAGGLKVDDPAMDLAICVSIVSSYQEIPIPHSYAFAGEVGLGGEVRAVNRIENRISEAEKLGFKKIFISSFNKLSGDVKKIKIEVVQVSNLSQVFGALFG